MNKLQSFIHNVLGEVRIIPSESGNPSETLFCALDVCRMLNYHEKSIHNAIKVHCCDLSKQQVTDSLGRQQTVNFIPLMDVFNLAFSSRRPEAEELRRWVTDEVLPSIYFTGEYIDENHDSNFNPTKTNPIFDTSSITEDILSQDNTISIHDNLGEYGYFDSTQIAMNCANVIIKMIQPLYENQQKVTDMMKERMDNMMDVIMKSNEQINNKINNDKHLIVPARIVEK